MLDLCMRAGAQVEGLQGCHSCCWKIVVYKSLSYFYAPADDEYSEDQSDDSADAATELQAHRQKGAEDRQEASHVGMATKGNELSVAEQEELALKLLSRR